MDQTKYTGKKIYLNTENGEKLLAPWTSADMVECAGGDNMENRINDLSAIASNLNIAQKTVNNRIDYGYFCLSETCNNAAGIDTIPFDKTMESHGIEINHGIFILKSNKTYKISYRLDGKTNTSSPTDAAYGLYDNDNSCFVTGLESFHANLKYSQFFTQDGFEYIYSAKSDTALCIKFKAQTRFTSLNHLSTYLLIEEIGRAITIDPLDHVDEAKGIQDTPVGHIMSHLGTTAPSHYLICDGATYNISDYPYLAEHFKSEFGAYNHFGGDGVTTFSVPDLRNEFLRGYHGAASALSGNIGEHQDGTKHSAITNYAGYMHVGETATNYDIINTVDWANVYNRSVGSDLKTIPSSYTSRPSNTAVLFCIKCEPTYYMKNTYGATELYSLEEQLVGRWINGKYIYKKTIFIGKMPNTSSKVVNTGITDIDTVIKISGASYDTEYFFNLPHLCASDNKYSIDLMYIKSSSSIQITAKSDRSNQNGYVTLYYTKTTDNTLQDYPNLEINETIYTDEEVTQMTNNIFGGEI